MRVALLSPYAEPVKGGITSYTRELAEAYRLKGFEVLFLSTVGGTGPSVETLGPSRLGFFLRATLRLIRWKPDVVHAHSHWYTLLPGVVVKWLLPWTKLLFTFHTPSASGQPGWRDRIFLWLVGRSDGVAFVSADLMESTGLPPSVNQAVIWAAPESLVLRDSGPSLVPRGRSILFIGPLVWPRKVAGVLVLLEAFARVSRSFPEWRVVIVGDGPGKVDVERRIHELQLENVVVLKGFVHDILPEIASAGIYAQISFQEGLPISLLNAMAVGSPVLATAVGGMAEVIRHRVTGFLSAPDVGSVAVALITMLEDRDLRSKLGAAAREEIRRDFSWARVADRCLTLVTKGSP